MHGDTILLMTFVLALVAAFAGGLAARALRLPAIVGYLAGGLVVGPFTPGFAGDAHAMQQLAEVGVMFMMFGTGLHFSIKDLIEVKGVAVPGALVQIALGTLAGTALAQAFGWSVEAGIMLGLSVSIASTVVLIKNLTDAGLYQSAGGRIATGWLIVEDLATVVVLVVLPVLFGPQDASGAAVAAGLAEALLKTVAFVVLMLLVGSRVLPWLLARIARGCPRELFQLAVVVTALGTAMAASVLFDLSVALGAFLAGVVVGTSKLSHRVAAEAIPFQDLFSIIFFASVGMMVNPVTLAAHLPELLAVLALIMVGKALVSMALGALFAVGVRPALTIAAGLAQIGEFSFIIGQTGMALGVLSSDQYADILGAAVISIALNAFAFQLTEPLARAIERRPALVHLFNRRARPATPPAVPAQGHVVVVGFGNAGAAVAEVLAGVDVPCLVVERDLAAAEDAEAAGHAVLIGDAANSEILAHAHLERARVLVLAISAEASAELIAREARTIAPDLHIVARAESADGVRALAAAGVDDLVRPELEGGIELMRHTLIDLGFRPRQIMTWANGLRESGYADLEDDGWLRRRHGAERLAASLAEVELSWVEVPEGCPLAGRTLAELDLRARTGANAVALRRAGDLTLFLDATTRVLPGDQVGLIGGAAEVDAARALLSACATGARA